MAENAGEYKLQLTGDEINAALLAVHEGKVVRNDAQTLTEEQKAQVRENIGTVINTQLDTAGQVADAKAVGDALTTWATKIDATETMLAKKEASTTATSNYTVGSLVIVGDQLLEVTSPIASGETISVGTNAKVSTLAEQVEDLERTKANTTGEYDGFISGMAKQIMSTKGGEEDSGLYSFRTTGGGLDVEGSERVEKVIGGTLLWNQVISNGNFNGSTGWTANNSSLSTANNIGTFTYTTATLASIIGTARPAFVKDHVYIAFAEISVSTANTPLRVVLAHNGGLSSVVGKSQQNSPANETWYRLSFIGVSPSTKSGYLQVQTSFSSVSRMSAGDKMFARRVQCFDITRIFGETIANRILALETSTTGAGVSLFRKLFPKDFYAYNAGALLSVNASAHKTVGFNAFDLTAGTAKLLGGMEYQITGAYTALSYSTGETITPDENGKFTPSENGVLTVTGGGGTTCVHLVWDGERDGQYEAYSAHTYALDDSLTLRGIPSLDSNNNLVYDGDTYEPDGTVTRKYAEMTGVTGAIGDTVTLTGIDTNATDILTSAGHLSDVGTLSGDTLTLTAALTDAAIVYPLAAPTTESADPYTETQVCDNWGTEEFEDAGVAAGTRDVAIPVGHLTTYQADLRAKLESAPGSPEIDGDYIMRRSNGINSYAPFTQSDIDVDETLSEEGEAADAKAAGDGIRGAQEMIAPREATDTATQNYAIGDYLVYDGKLYKVTAAIANGETITPGTNVSEDKVSEELKVLEANKLGKNEKAQLAENAYQLVSSNSSNEQVPYTFRTAGGSLEIGDRVNEKAIIGGTLCWNQLVPNGNFSSTGGWSDLSIDTTAHTGTYTAPSTFKTTTFLNCSGFVKASIIPNHVYYTACDITVSRTVTKFTFYIGGTQSGNCTAEANVKTRLSSIIKTSSTISSSVQYYRYYPNKDGTTQEGDTFTFENWICIDLTKMFGETIADRLRALNSTSAAKILLTSLFPKKYYAYDAGTLRSVNTLMHKTIGFNAYNKSTGTAQILNNKEYQITGTYSTLSCATGQVIIPDENGKFTPRFNDILTVTGGNGTTCIHLVYDGERDGEYEDYSVHTYELDGSITLRGLPSFDGNDNLLYDGDRYTSDGTIIRNYTELTEVTGAVGDTITLTGINTEATDIVTSAGHLAEVGTLSGDILTLTKALSNATIVYPLATSTTESADPYQETQICDNWGTEEYIDAGVAAGTRDVAIPVGHDSDYLDNLRDKLDVAPNAPSEDGDYLMHRENGQNSYLKFNILEYIQAAQPWYVGADLTTKFADEIATFDSVWTWIQHRIQSGNFLGLNIGDYIPFTSTDSRSERAYIAGINTYKYLGSASGDTSNRVGNHIDFITGVWNTNWKPKINPAGYNNGLVPVETITGDGTTTEFTLTKQMTEVNTIKQGSTSITDWTYDASTYTITFVEAPAAGAITVTGKGTGYPWLTCNLYYYINSLAGQVPNGTALNPAVAHVDYTQSGIYYYLPEALKDVIVNKYSILEARYSASAIKNSATSFDFKYIGKLWVPSEIEMYGGPRFGDKSSILNNGVDNTSHYPLFDNMNNRIRSTGVGGMWLLNPAYGQTAYWCAHAYSGAATMVSLTSGNLSGPVGFRIS